MVRRYAENTSVSVDSSRGEMSGILAKHGVQRMAWGTEPEGDTLQFELDGRRFMFRIAKPTVDSLRERDGGQYVYPHNVDWQAKVAQEWRRRWRAHVLLLKAKLEFVEAGDSTLEREFMPFLMLANGSTVEQALANGGLKALGAGK